MGGCMAGSALPERAPAGWVGGVGWWVFRKGRHPPARKSCGFCMCSDWVSVNVAVIYYHCDVGTFYPDWMPSQEHSGFNKLKNKPCVSVPIANRMYGVTPIMVP